MSFKDLHLWVLKGQLAVPASSLDEWLNFFGKAHRQVIAEQLGSYVISTVFLGVDHNFGTGLPILFESMIFNDRHDSIDQDRCGTWEEAIEMHERMVAKVMAMIEGGSNEEDPSHSQA